MAENILHFGGVRFRVNGNGSLQLTLKSLDDAVTKDLLALPMTASPGKEPLRISNFVQQRARLQGQVTELDEWFKINRIVLYVKEIYTSYPG